MQQWPKHFHYEERANTNENAKQIQQCGCKFKFNLKREKRKKKSNFFAYQVNTRDALQASRGERKWNSLIFDQRERSDVFVFEAGTKVN